MGLGVLFSLYNLMQDQYMELVSLDLWCLSAYSYRFQFNYHQKIQQKLLQNISKPWTILRPH